MNPLDPMNPHLARSGATTVRPRRTLVLAAAAAARAVPGVAYLSPGPRGGAAASGFPRRDPAAGVHVTSSAHAWNIRIHLAVCRGHRAATVAREVRRAVREELSGVTGSAGWHPHPSDAQVDVGIVVTAVL